jgi:hypothetical protein
MVTGIHLCRPGTRRGDAVRFRMARACPEKAFASGILSVVRLIRGTPEKRRQRGRKVAALAEAAKTSPSHDITV